MPTAENCKEKNMIVDIIDNEKSVDQIVLNIKILRGKKERRQSCVYGPGKESLGHKCDNCEDDKKLCLNVNVEIDNTGYGYVTSDEKTIYSLLNICEPVLKVKTIG